MVFELYADLPLVGLVSDEGVLQQLLCWWALRVILHEAALDETEELFGPVSELGERNNTRLRERIENREVFQPCNEKVKQTFLQTPHDS